MIEYLVWASSIYWLSIANRIWNYHIRIGVSEIWYKIHLLGKCVIFQIY